MTPMSGTIHWVTSLKLLPAASAARTKADDESQTKSCSSFTSLTLYIVVCFISAALVQCFIAGNTREDYWTAQVTQWWLGLILALKNKFPVHSTSKNKELSVFVPVTGKTLTVIHVFCKMFTSHRPVAWDRWTSQSSEGCFELLTK